MYDPIETDISYEQLVILSKKCKKINTCIIGGWATYFYVNREYRAAFGKDYMGSRDIDIFFDSSKEKEFNKIITGMGFAKNGLPFRYELIYNRETKKFITQDEAREERVYNLIYIFLDLFSDKETKIIKSWWDLKPLKKVSPFIINGFSVADIDTLIALKCTVLFARDKADKENKDACDLYALLEYSNKKIVSTPLLLQAIKKILARQDLLYSIAQNVLLDTSKQSIVEVSLKSRFEDLGNH